MVDPILPMPAPPPVKPGKLTTEFLLTAIVTFVGLLIASGLIPTDSQFGKILGLAASLFGTMGYTVSRGAVKAAATTTGIPAPPMLPNKP